VTAPTTKPTKRQPARPTRGEPAKPSKGQQRQLDILAAARRLLVDDGYDGFVLREVAARLGIQLGNLQYYYATRDDLLEGVIRAEFTRNQGEIATLSAGSRPPREKLARIVRHLLDVWAREGGRVYVVMSLLAIHYERFAGLHREIYGAFYEGLVPVLAELRPKLKRAELRRLARLVTALVDGSLVQNTGRGLVADTVTAALLLAES
jgi:AcrR family transcriptional regulator